jgi:hypothetical protein
MKHNRIVQEIKGMALVMVLVIVTVTAGMLAVIMYYSMTGSEVSGIQRRYQSAKEASLGAMDVVTKEIITRVLQQNVVGGATQDLSGVLNSFSTIFGQVPAAAGATDPCFLAKLRTATGAWPAACKDSDASKQMNPSFQPDMTFNLLSASSGSARPFVVQVKIVDTSAGNTDMSGLDLEGSAVAGQGGGTIAVKHFPYLYTIESDGRLQNSTSERANLEFLYAY